MAVIDHGRVIAEGTSRELKASVGGHTLHVHLSDQEKQKEASTLITKLLGNALLPNNETTSLAVKVPDPTAAADILNALSRAQIRIVDFSLGAPSLDDAFFSLTGKPTQEGRNAAEKGAVP